MQRNRDTVRWDDRLFVPVDEVLRAWRSDCDVCVGFGPDRRGPVPDMLVLARYKRSAWRFVTSRKYPLICPHDVGDWIYGKVPR